MYRGNWSHVVGYCFPRLSLYMGVGLRLLVTASIGCPCAGGIALNRLSLYKGNCSHSSLHQFVYCVNRLSLYRGMSLMLLVIASLDCLCTGEIGLTLLVIASLIVFVQRNYAQITGYCWPSLSLYSGNCAEIIGYC